MYHGVPSPVRMQNDNALSFFSISSFLQESLYNQPKKCAVGKQP